MHVRRQTIQEAIAKGREALRNCLEVCKEAGRKPVKPKGVSINSLVTAIIAEAVGFRQGAGPRRRWGSEHNGGGGTPPAKSRRGVI